MARRIILFELNEVPWRIMDAFCKWHPDSWFARTLPLCHQFETHTEDHGHLSPWTTWPSLHRAVPDTKHFIANFGQDLKEQNQAYPAVWDLLRKGGVSVGLCGSLHSYPMPEDLTNFKFYLPDTFAAGSECFPDKLSLFQEFNLSMARESARNVSSKVAWGPALKMLLHSPELGFKLKTFADIGGHLVSERMKNWRKVRRRTYQVVLAFDIFHKFLNDTRPAFSSFFTNHVASSMHRFWAAAFPSDYQQFGYDDAWVGTYCEEIDFTMKKFEEFFRRLVGFVNANPDYQLWIATSMGQAATEALPMETQLYLKDIPRFMEKMGVGAGEFETRPAMLPQVNVFVQSGKAAEFEKSLGRITIDGKPMSYRQASAGFFSLDFGQPNLHVKPDALRVDGQIRAFNELGLEAVEIEDRSGASAYHIPQGSLLIYDPLKKHDPALNGPRSKRTQISALDIAPAILRNYNLPIPEYMNTAPELIPG